MSTAITPPAYTKITPTFPGLLATDTVLLLGTVRAAQRRDSPEGLIFLDWDEIKASAAAADLSTTTSRLHVTLSPAATW